MTKAAIEARDLTVGYRRRGRRYPVLSGLDLVVGRGAFVCLIGPNGVGKTTLLRTLSGSLGPLAGQLLLDGRAAAGLRDIERARLVGLVRTERFEVGSLSAARVVSLGRYPHVGWGGRLGPADHDAVRRSLAAVGAEHLADRDVMELSDGERQRVNIARALAQEPAILLLDEPTAFLDVAGRVELMGLLRRLAREGGVTIVASTHELDLALRTADRIWLVGPDRSLSDGAPEDLVADGAFADAFLSDRISFDPEARTFRLRREPARSAIVIGDGLGAVLVSAVLEREGFDLRAADRPDALRVTAIGARGAWSAAAPGVARTGATYAELAAFVRALAEESSIANINRENTHAY
ncbi:MAG: ABC transporter ATP-binding protein [Bauldia sp.]